MDEPSCDTGRPFWLVYANPHKHPDRLRFVGACDTEAGAEAARVKAQKIADDRAKGKGIEPVRYSVIGRDEGAKKIKVGE